MRDGGECCPTRTFIPRSLNGSFLEHGSHLPKLRFLAGALDFLRLNRRVLAHKGWRPRGAESLSAEIADPSLRLVTNETKERYSRRDSNYGNN